ncbi:MAG: methylaspartate mutase, partial [Abditibacteriota bacterium]|nr:methylaspartate mutase [Abditibacteriota bacterium]
KGITMLAVDSIFMIPHLGVLSSVDPEAAAQVFEKDCIVRLGHVISPVGRCPRHKGEAVLETDGREIRLPWGKLTHIGLAPGEYPARLTPGIRADFGRGKGKILDFTLIAGVCGAFADLRAQ